MLWFALLIPLILSILAYWKFNKDFLWWEVILPTIISFFFILTSFLVIKNVDLADIEYNGYIITEARYYESWQTWIHKTCSYTTRHSCGKNCSYTTTHYYDCSYCDYNSPYWVAVDNGGNTFRISQAKYNQLIRKWKSQPTFVELDRNINYHGSCGKDGDMYYIKWDNRIESSEASVIEKPFKNPVKISHSAFNYIKITDGEADTIGLYHYPSFYDTYKQPAILGLSRFIIPDKALINTKFEFLNGYYGPKYKVKVFTLLFKNKPIDIALKQEAYWNGGNQNELVVCIGLKDNLEIDWVKPFTWCDNKRIVVDTREDIAELKIFKPDNIYNIYVDNISKYFKYKSFKDFNYLTFEPTKGQIVFVYLGTFIISIMLLFWAKINEIY